MAQEQVSRLNQAPIPADQLDTIIRSDGKGKSKSPATDEGFNISGQKKSDELLTYGMVQKTLRGVGIVMSRPNGLYRINFFGGLPSTERFTDTLENALEAGLKLASTRKGPAWPLATKS